MNTIWVWAEHVQMSVEEFLFMMLELGKPLDISFVGAFDDDSTPGRGSRKDMDLPLHRDGVFSQALSDAQGGVYLERAGIDWVGLYCLRGGKEPCYTTLSTNDQVEEGSVNLQRGEGLIFDNTKLFHGRRGPVGERVLLRVWVQKRTPK